MARALRRMVLPLYIALAACTPTQQADMPTRAANASETQLPAMRVFGAPQPERFAISNSDLARDFLDLTFQLESGRPLPVLSRFEGPVTVRVTGAQPPTLGSDLSRLLFRLRNEAGIDISLNQSPAANITIEAVSRAQIRRHLPHAACFVAPNIRSLSEFRLARRTAKTDWTRLRTRTVMAVFVPNDASPQELRDCLHEELSQALGPLNDLYRLPQSVFNDDNVHAVLTGFDMTILRAYYAPELRAGMSRAEVADRLPAILARINPGGAGLPPRAISTTPRDWSRAMETALGPVAGMSERREAAVEAVNIARVMGWQDHRAGMSHYAAGRLLLPVSPDAAIQHFRQADAYFARRPEYAMYRARVAAQLAAYLIAQGRGDEAVTLIGPHLPVVARHENAALMATLSMMRAEALDLAGRGVEAQAVRLDSLGWARYGFGPEGAIRAKMREISSLNPLNRRNGRI